MNLCVILYLFLSLNSINQESEFFEEKDWLAEYFKK